MIPERGRQHGTGVALAGVDLAIVVGVGMSVGADLVAAGGRRRIVIHFVAPSASVPSKWR